MEEDYQITMIESLVSKDLDDLEFEPKVVDDSNSEMEEMFGI